MSEAPLKAGIIDGKAFAAALRAETALRVKTLSFRPKLVVILVGDNKASRLYVKNKQKAALEAGFESLVVTLPALVTEAELLSCIAFFNDDSETDGILIQLPLPGHICPATVIEAIDPAKDVDGFHPFNIGRMMSGRRDCLIPCTPVGIMKLLAAFHGSVAGAEAVVIGRSAIVGKPLAALLTKADATVTLVHSKTLNSWEICRRADILIAAAGSPLLVKASWVKKGATVIDVGINTVDGHLVGDVDFADVSQVAGKITPVPGGVGPVTIACLLENTLKAACLRRKIS